MKNLIFALMFSIVGTSVAFAQVTPKGIVGVGKTSVSLDNNSNLKLYPSKLELAFWGEGKARVKLNVDAGSCGKYLLTYIAIDKGLGEYELYQTNQDFLDDKQSIGSIMLFTESMALIMNDKIYLGKDICTRSFLGFREERTVDLIPGREHTFKF